MPGGLDVCVLALPPVRASDWAAMLTARRRLAQAASGLGLCAGILSAICPHRSNRGAERGRRYRVAQAGAIAAAGGGSGSPAEVAMPSAGAAASAGVGISAACSTSCRWPGAPNR